MMSRLSKVFNGGKQNVSLSTFNYDGTPNTTLAEREVKRGPLKTKEDWYTVNMPAYTAWTEARSKEAEEKGQQPDEEMVYRLYKGSNWHEQQHVAYSPPEFLKGTDPDFNSQTKHSLFNIVDDLRIEETGVNRLPGFVPIRLLRQAYWGSRRPDVTELSKNYTDDTKLSENEGLKRSAHRFAREKFNTKDPTEAQINEAFEEHKESFRKTKRKEVVMEAFVQLLLMGKEKGELPKEDQEKLNAVTSEIRSEVRKLEEEKQGDHETYNSIKKLVEKFMLEMNIDDDDKDETGTDLPGPHGDPGEQGQPGQGAGGFDPHEIEKMLNELNPDKEGKREDGDPGIMLTREDIEEAINGTPADANELQKIKKAAAMIRAPDEDPASPDEFEEPLSNGDPQLYRDKKFINEMNERLSEWRSGWRRVFGTFGTSFNVQRELSTKGEQSFSGRQRLDASKTKTLFIVDFSGSMTERQEDYKKVIASTMEVLEGIHSQTAVFGFGEASAEFFKLKDFRQKWNKTRGEQLAGMNASGSTPLTTTLNLIEPYVKRNRPQYTVVITDGDPTDGDPSSIVKTLSKSTHMVGFGLGTNAEKAASITGKLKGFGIRESFAETDIHQIPKKLIPKIAPVS